MGYYHLTFHQKWGPYYLQSGVQSNYKFLSWGSIFQIEISKALPRSPENKAWNEVLPWMFYWGNTILGNGQYPWRVRGGKEWSRKERKTNTREYITKLAPALKGNEAVTESLNLSVSHLLDIVFLWSNLSYRALPLLNLQPSMLSYLASPDSCWESHSILGCDQLSQSTALAATAESSLSLC